MSSIEVTSENIASTVAKSGIVFLDFWAPWCGPCRTFGPIFERAAKAHPDIVFGKVNTEEQADLAEEFNISSIPTLIVIRDGMLLYAEPGMLPDAALNKLIEEVRKLDMDAIRRGPILAEPQVGLA